VIPSESSVSSCTENEVQELVARVTAEDPSPPPFNIHPDGLEVEARHRAAADRLIANPRINRECCELYLDVGPLQASISLRSTR
jgi:hypothetical protein